jgi:predicted Rossmann fold flavoprotein
VPGASRRRTRLVGAARGFGLSDSATFDVAIVGAGAAGLHCAAMAGQLGLRAVLIEHAEKVAEKIRISGGGRCNFTNIETSPAQFLSRNPDFCRSALARYTPRDFIDLLGRHRIAWHEKHRGQLFCDESSQQVIDMLLAECAAGAVAHWQPCRVEGIALDAGRFTLATSRGAVVATRLVVASGGLSIPKIGASDFGYRVARQFGHAIVATRPALVPLVLAEAPGERFAALAGVSLPVRVVAGDGAARAAFDEDLLFTHRGLSGPAALQISSYWLPGGELTVDLAPGLDLQRRLLDAKRSSTRKAAAVLGEALPRRFVDAWLQEDGVLREHKLADCRDRDLADLAAGLHGWRIRPSGTEGYRKAEVTIGGVDTRELDSRNCESRRIPGLHFIGEVVDVTGWLGGYNFQWAWASAAACARAMASVCGPTHGGL